VNQTGKDEHQIQERENRKKIRSRLLMRTIMFISGFSVVFILLGISTITVGSIFYDYGIWIARIGGAILIVFGIHLTGLFKIPFLERQLGFKMKNKPTSQVGSFMVGMSFDAGWTPCIGPHFSRNTYNCRNKQFNLDLYSTFVILCIGTCYTFFYFSIDNRKIYLIFQKN
jgi:cytochrome c biogenesis protein CcdA